MGEPTKPPEEQTAEAYKETFMKLGDGVFRECVASASYLEPMLTSSLQHHVCQYVSRRLCRLVTLTLV